MEREQALDLLRSNHTFPGPFQFQVIVRPPAATSTVTAMAAAAGDGARVLNVDERHSSKGTYVALHVNIEVAEAESVLDVYEVLGSMDQVLAKM
jgi:putative lipoic acid-binding regulatory protein